MSSEDIFDNVDHPPIESVVPDTSLNVPAEVAELVGEGKKYKTVEDALKSVPHAQGHIAKLEQEMATLREEVAKRKAAEELLDELKAVGATAGTPPAKVDIKPEDIAKTVEMILDKKQSEDAAKENIKHIKDAFVSAFGEKAKETYAKIAGESGLTVEQLNFLSAKSPQVVRKLAGIDETKQNVFEKQHSTVNTESFRQDQNQNKTAKVSGGSTKDMVSAWRMAGELVKG